MNDANNVVLQKDTPHAVTRFHGSITVTRNGWWGARSYSYWYWYSYSLVIKSTYPHLQGLCGTYYTYANIIFIRRYMNTYYRWVMGTLSEKSELKRKFPPCIIQPSSQYISTCLIIENTVAGTLRVYVYIPDFWSPRRSRKRQWQWIWSFFHPRWSKSGTLWCRRCVVIFCIDDRHTYVFIYLKQP